jgi:hypothetical protein
MTTTIDHKRAIGHLDLHYLPGDEQAARRLLVHLGCTLIDNGPRPGADGFCTVLVDESSATYADNIFFLSPLGAAQQDLEAAIRDKLGIGSADQDPTVTAFAQKRQDWPEAASHFGIRYASLEALESALGRIESDARPGGALTGRVQVSKFIARAGLDPEIDSRMAASPIFTGDEHPAFADYWVQCFVKTDLFGYGILAFGQTIELDYVFEPFFSQPPKFG